MVFLTAAIAVTWGLGYMVTVETLQGNALLSEYVEIGSHLASVPHLEPIRVHAARHGLDPALVAAIISQESGFRANAVSPAGARGLMQLLPSTWRHVRPSSACPGTHGPPACGPDCIFDPEANIAAGTAYFAELLREFDGNIVLAFAAYNAGRSAVRAYATGPDGSLGEELPPFRETRAYVTRVLSFWVGLRAGGIPDVVTLSIEEARLLRQLATIMPGVVLGLWGLFALWVLRRLEDR
ncbi:MAG: lytic transglycosylase domain-containing protein [Bacillota bacterium]|jgi:soluble lytic murein transglycosylase